MRLQISANTGSARSATVTYTISSTNGGPDVSESFTVNQAAASYCNMGSKYYSRSL
jgi:hypothetical protein